MNLPGLVNQFCRARALANGVRAPWVMVRAIAEQLLPVGSRVEQVLPDAGRELGPAPELGWMTGGVLLVTV